MPSIRGNLPIASLTRFNYLGFLISFATPSRHASPPGRRRTLVEALQDGTDNVGLELLETDNDADLLNAVGTSWLQIPRRFFNAIGGAALDSPLCGASSLHVIAGAAFRSDNDLHLGKQSRVFP